MEKWIGTSNTVVSPPSPPFPLTFALATCVKTVLETRHMDLPAALAASAAATVPSVTTTSWNPARTVPPVSHSNCFPACVQAGRDQAGILSREDGFPSHPLGSTLPRLYHTSPASHLDNEAAGGHFDRDSTSVAEPLSGEHKKDGSDMEREGDVRLAYI